MLKYHYVTKFWEKIMTKKILKESIIPGAYLQYVCKHNPKFQLHALITVKGVDYTQ